MMRVHASLCLSILMVLILGLCVAPASTMYGQDESPSQTTFLPLIVALAGVQIAFGSGVDDADALVNQGTTFAYGITRLYSRYTVVGAQGLTYRTEWTVDGIRQPLLDDSSTIPFTTTVFTNYFCSPTLGSCGEPLPRGTYQVTCFIDDAPYQQATARIE